MRFAPKRFLPSTTERYEEMIKEIIYQSDIILMVLDARMPEISRNKRIEELLKENTRKFIFVLNKSDIAAKKTILTAKKKLLKIAPVVELSAETGDRVQVLRKMIYAMLDKMENPYKKVGILGYPNMGKSALINKLSKRRAAKVAPVAGFTKGIHWIRGKSMELVDGPGYIETKDKMEQLKLGFIGAQNPEKLKDPENMALSIIEVLLTKKGKGIEENYKIKITSKDPFEILETIGKKLGHLKKGGVIETKRTSMVIIRDWQSGKLRI